jgi:hypothetical protein
MIDEVMLSLAHTEALCGGDAMIETRVQNETQEMKDPGEKHLRNEPWNAAVVVLGCPVRATPPLVRGIVSLGAFALLGERLLTQALRSPCAFLPPTASSTTPRSSSHNPWMSSRP